MCASKIGKTTVYPVLLSIINKINMLRKTGDSG